MAAGQEGDSGDAGAPEPGAPDPAALMRDWMTVVASELAGIARDREVQEAWAGLVGLWARGMAGDDAAAADPAGAAAAVAASGAGGELARLRDRVDALERRLAALERGGAG